VEEPEAPWGVVPVDARGSLPFTLIHGESLVAAASWALTTAGAELFDYDVGFDAVRESGRALVIHDPLCPLTPVSFLGDAIEEAANSGAVVVGVRPVTDTVKQYDDTVLGATVDRDDLVCVTSPVVLPAAVLSSLEDLDTDDLAELVAALTSRFPVRFLEGPALGRRIAGEGDLAILAGLSSTER
jgi:2-C-methyl-D-erythritol 4-phosphate cytidylyltransferase